MDDKGKKEIAVYANEIEMFAKLFTHSPLAKQSKFLKNKGLKRFSKKQCDSVLQKIVDYKKIAKQDPNLPQCW